MTISIVNLTQHDVTVFADSHKFPVTSLFARLRYRFRRGQRIKFPVTGVFARRAETRSPGPLLPTQMGEVPREEVTYQGVVDLPPPAAGIAYLVSRVVAAESDREDLYFPSAELRDHRGRIIGCRALGRFSQA